MTKTPSISKNGKTTKNQEMALYPLEHKKFKNHVQTAINNALTRIEKNWNFLIIAKTRLIAAMTK